MNQLFDSIGNEDSRSEISAYMIEEVSVPEVYYQPVTTIIEPPQIIKIDNEAESKKIMKYFFSIFQ